MQFWSLRTEGSDCVSYERARALQQELVELRARDEIPDTVLFLEHEPVVTRGKGLQLTGEERPRHMPLPPLPDSVSFAESERGGDLTYHGPGQLVIYPICKLDGKGLGPNHDVAGFLRRMERVLIDELDERLAQAGSRCESVPNATGVWVRPRDSAREPRKIAPLGTDAKKIASMGIAVRKWVTYHGLALNCVNDLAPFRLISPCGFSPEVMTRLEDWVRLDARSWRQDLETALARRMAGQGAFVEPKTVSRQQGE